MERPESPLFGLSPMGELDDLMDWTILDQPVRMSQYMHPLQL